MEEPQTNKPNEEPPAPETKTDSTETKIEESSLTKAAWKVYKAEFASSFVPTFNFSMIAIALLAVGIWQPLTLYVTFPFVLLPFYFALQISISDAREGHPFTNRSFFHFYGMYYRMPYLGVYRVIVNFIFSFLWSLLVSGLVYFAYYWIASAVDPVFVTGITDLYNAFMNGSLDNANSVLANNASVARLLIVVDTVETGTTFLVFLQYLGVWSLNPYIRSVMKRSAPSPRMANSLFTGGLRQIRKEFSKEYFKATWLGMVLAIVGFGGGAAIAGVLTVDPAVIAASGIAGSLVLLFFYLPYFFIVVELLANHFDENFAKYSISFAEQTLKQLEETKRLSEEEAKEIQKMIDDAKNGNPPPPEDDDDDNDDDDYQ
jgi:hypothetical protein